MNKQPKLDALLKEVGPDSFVYGGGKSGAVIRLQHKIGSRKYKTAGVVFVPDSAPDADELRDLVEIRARQVIGL